MPRPNRPSDALRREYAAFATHYEERWQHYLSETARHTLKALAPHEGERILDAGCGTGFALAQLASRRSGLDLSGLDASPEMLARARGRLPTAVELVRGDLECMPYAAGRFDAVITMNALHYLDDPAFALEEIARVLRPGGRLVVTDWCRDFFVMFLCEHWLRLRKRPLGRVMGTRELVAIASDAGLRIDSLVRFKVRPAWGLMTLCAHRPD